MVCCGAGCVGNGNAIAIAGPMLGEDSLNSRGLVMGDFNKDGRKDFAKFASKHIQFFISKGAATLSDLRLLPTPPPSLPPSLPVMQCDAMQCDVMEHIVMRHALRHCVVVCCSLYCTVLCCDVLCRRVLFIVLYCIVLRCAVLRCGG